MKTIGWMLTRMIVIRFLVILFGISIFVLTLDVVTYANEILALRQGQLEHHVLIRADARAFDLCRHSCRSAFCWLSCSP